MFQADPNRIYFQAHRGSVDERPENTLVAFRHAWHFPGAIPETDVRTTRDGVLICLHDATLARTTDAPDEYKDVPVSRLTEAEVRRWDAGVRFSPAYAGQHVPTLREVLAELSGHPERALYLEVKDADFQALGRLLDEYGVWDQILFIAGNPAWLLELQRLFPGVPTMTWLSGSPEKIQAGFEHLARTDFAGITQLQMHLHAAADQDAIRYLLDEAFLQYAQERLRKVGAVLQLRPFRFDGPSLRRLIDLGVHWFVADAPEQFSAALAAARR
ncbi:hypothetical protein FKZ61_017890 [Litorilinea aerophila]|nr:glycerophosphodiester phosphodiesterase family protein [Litorilinea aerophila]MCC9077972.1 hypothetical protein [Litorilinea aerophila]OUC08132.1 hypothetical protein RY27_10780 [Litorilinea aerophila]GIV76674.1 MAG: hypothetical protein KatS3mg050_1068 [Litorilinea sp.]